MESLRARASYAWRRQALFAGVSVTALAVAGVLSGALWSTPAAASSPAAAAQAAAQRLAQSQAGSLAGPLASPAARAQIALSAANLARAAEAFKAQAAAQAAARVGTAAVGQSTPLSTVIPVDDTDKTLWIGADPLENDKSNQRVAGGGLQAGATTTTLTIHQTAQNAVLTWLGFDLNAGETVVFDQPSATASALNRIMDPSLSPSLIFGTVKANGSVYFINRNGIIFGPTAQINVHSLIASSLDVGDPTMTTAQRNGVFLNNGIASGATSTSFSSFQSDPVVQGDVTVEAGATVTASKLPSSVSPDAGGFVYLFAPNVSNAGTIDTPAGQTMMVAAQSLILTPNKYAAGGIITANASFRATGVDFPGVSGGLHSPWQLDAPPSGQITAPGKVSNTGLINADRGVVILNGDVVTQAGVIQADTSITRNGAIYLDGRLQLTMGAGSSTQILPADDGETIPLSAIASFTPGIIELSGNTVDFAANSLVVAPGGSVSVVSLDEPTNIISYPTAVLSQVKALQRAVPRIFMDTDSTIDVSGLDDVVLPMSANLVTFTPFGNEFADQPLQRQGALRGQSLTVDIRQSGTLNGVAWIGTPLADVNSLAANVAVGVDQLLTTGGTVSMTSKATAGSEIITRQGSMINVAGGYVEYQGGFVATTNLLTADGRIVNIANASPLGDYTGIAGVTTVTHPHWGASTSETFVNPLLAGGAFEVGYVEGRDAGGVTLSATSYALDGSFSAGVIVGERQRALGKLPSAATANTVTADPTAMPSAGYLRISGRNNLVLESQVEYQALPSGFGPADPLAGADAVDRVNNTFLSADALSQADFGSISANFSGNLRVTGAASLTVNPGGSISLTGGSVDIEGRLTAKAGSITAEASALVAGEIPGSATSNYQATSATPPNIFNLTIGSGAVLDASGQWVNDTGAGAENLVGGAYVNGGSITLRTDAQSATFGTGHVDLTGNIILAAGSRLDVSSGGRLTASGQFQLDSFGRPAGNGGNVTLQTYVGQFSTNAPPIVPTTTTPDANIIFQAADGTADGTVRAISDTISAFGFAQGGTFSLQAPSIQIGGAAPTDPGIFYLPANFFTGNGATAPDPLISVGSAFSSFKFASVVGTIGSSPGAQGIGIAIMPGTTVALQQQNLLAGNADPTLLGNLATGANVAAVAAAKLIGVQQNAALRSAVSLQLSAALSVVPYPYNAATADNVTSPQVALLLGKGAAIVGDAHAGIGLTAIGLTVSGRSASSVANDKSQVGDIAAQTAVADIEGSISAPGGSIALTDRVGAASEFYLGAQSRLDVSGLVVTDSRQTAFHAGQVLPGGTVSVKLADAGSALVALPGAVIDVSGTTGTFDLPHDGSNAGLPGVPRVATTVWSDAGSIFLSAPTLLYDGSILAQPGGNHGQGSGNGGSLTVATPQIGANPGTLTVQQSAAALPDGLAPTDALPTALAGDIIFQADLLGGSGITSLTLSSGLIAGDTPNTASYAPGTIAFNGNVTFGGLNPAAGGLQSLTLDASTVQLQAGVSSDVNLAANYVALRGSKGTAVPTAGDGTLTVSGNLIDIAASGTLTLSNVATANFVSSGDIRLRVPLASVSNDLAPGVLPAGELLTAGNLTLTAAQIYPVSDVDVTLKSIGTDGTITFLGNGAAAAAPLSAGGQVTVSAAHIVQDGTLLAPLGVIRLGAQTASELSPNDPAQQSPSAQNFVATQDVTLGSGSVTSVSLDGLTVPFGETSDGQNWHYDSISGRAIAAPPAKDIAISGGTVDAASGAKLVLSGGGDIQAMEFVPGTGGTRDSLANNPNVFAIIPGYNPVAAPIDLDFLLAQGDALPSAGSSVYLSGGPGFAAGYYTLLPAHYATLPGAFRVSLVANSQDALASNNLVLADGTLQMAGRFADPSAGSISARSVAFDVQSATVWRQYSEIDKTSANTFFAGQTLASTGAVPRLPMEAGHLSINIGQSTQSVLDLSGLNAAPAAGGGGAEVDIAAQDIQILSGASPARAGYLGLDATQLSASGFDSLLIGGIRSDSSSGETITAIANSVEVSNSASAPLTAAEVILVTRADPASTDPNAARGLAVDAGSAITASGKLAASDPSTVTIGSASGQISGTGALLSVSNRAPLLVQRQDAAGTSGLLTVASGATLKGTGLTLDTTGDLQIAADATLIAPDLATAVSLASRSINFGPAAKNATGLIVSNALLAQLERAQSLTLRSAGTINFFGNTTIALDAAASRLTLDAKTLVATKGAAVAISAAAFEWDNSATAGKTPAAGSGSLTVTAGTVVFGAGDKTLSGFAAAQFLGSQQIAARGTGSLNVGAAGLTFDTPFVLVGAGAQQSISTTAAVTLKNSASAGAATKAAEIGGTLTINAASISDATLLQATAGGVTLHATTGDITLASNAQILATGFVQTFFDTTRSAAGGSVQLVADQGGIEVDSGAAINVASDPTQPGNAGSITLSAANGTLSSGHGGAFDSRTIQGNVAGDGGGSLTIDVQSMGTTLLSAPSIFSDTVDVHVRQGALELAAGTTVAAQNVTLTTDAGTLEIDGTINASGKKGGNIALYGPDVTLGATAQLLARASDAGQNGGTVVIGAESGGIQFAANSQSAPLIDVTGGAGATGGTLRLRAPIIGNGNIYDSSNVDVAIGPVKAAVVGASNVTIEAYQVFTPGNTANAFNGVIDPANNAAFFGSLNATTGKFQGDLVQFVQSFSLADKANFAAIDQNVIHYQPGIELDNNDPGVNGGNITVASNWNLAAGTYDPATQTITSMAYRVGGSASGEAGALTLRASGNLLINADISDGFFQTQNRLDPTYVAAMNAWVSKVEALGASTTAANAGDYIRDVGGYILAGALYPDAPPGVVKKVPIGPPPVAPYDPAANLISPTATATDQAPIAGADLMPLITSSGQIGGSLAMTSWSYNLVGGADLASANPLAVRPLAALAASGSGNVIINGHTQVKSAGAATAEIPTIVRTGTGAIAIAAGLDFQLADKTAPGVVYTAGRNSAAPADPGFSLQSVPDPRNAGQSILVPVAGNSSGFLTPQVLTCQTANGCDLQGVITAAAYPVDGGDLSITAQRDILGIQHQNSQFYAPWLLAQGTSLSGTAFGAFSPLSAYASTGTIFTPSQTSWWINFGSFDQGVMSVGGDVRIQAGRDISQLSVSLPTTARVSGGLSSTMLDANGNTVANIPSLGLSQSGDLTVIAGRNLLSGAYYEGSGSARISVGGSVQANWASTDPGAPDPSNPGAFLPNQVSTILAVDTGTIALRARGSLDLAGVVSAIALENVADPLSHAGLSDANVDFAFLSSYGQSSAVSLQSVAGTITANSLFNANALVENPIFNSANNNKVQLQFDAGFAGVSSYPASFDAAALLGDVRIADSLRLAPSASGTLDLLAQGSLLTYNYVIGNSGNVNVASPENVINRTQVISTGPSIVEATFDPLQPLAGFGPAAGSLVSDLGPELLHQGDQVPNLFYAVTGDIVSGFGVAGTSPLDASARALGWEITKTAKVQAGRDIVDLPFFGQNLAVTDVTQIIAGRDIFYTGELQQANFVRTHLPSQNIDGLSLAGPGFFDVEAGRNLGPFVTATADIADQNNDNSNGVSTDPIGTGIITFGNSVTVGNRLISADQGLDSKVAPLDPFGTGSNSLLPHQGAEIIALFGVAKGIDYQAVINAYLNPNPPAGTAVAPRRYLPLLVTFLQTLGFPAQSPSDAFATFTSKLSPALQHAFVDDIFFNELERAGNTANPDHAAGYAIINTLFPTALGYTNNATLNNAVAERVDTGNIEMLHATIKTLQSTLVATKNVDGTASLAETGGDILLLGPGGNIDVGSQAREVNSHLTASALGILTLGNGSIGAFTDGDVLVNQSRILTTQGGDILLWSSNGNLDAGRGAKTTVDFQPLTVEFSPQDLQTVDLNGLVTGAGIGTIQSTPDAPIASAFLDAPRGTVNIGDAGVRTSGALAIAALHVLNAGNISSLGAVSGVPQTNAVNLGALESAGNSAGQAASAAEQAVGAATRGNQAPAPRPRTQITVEVLGFGDFDPGS